MYIMGSLVLMGFVMYYLFLPVFHNLKLISTYQYLETRYNNCVRLFGSVLFIFGSLLWLPIVIYVPALAFNQATGINVHLITPLVSLVCIFYTCVGGLKAVVWTDVVQTLIMFGAMLLIIVKGTIDVGGLGVVYTRAKESGRIEPPNLTFDLTERYTVYSLFIGGVAHFLKSNAISQNMIQRYLSLPTLKKARISVWTFIFGVLIFMLVCGYSGLLIYATYHDCDPLMTKLAERKDQLLPLLVMETLGEYPGLPGLFVAGVFSAALSSLSTGLNSMSAVVLEDFVKSFYKKTLSERATAYIMRSVVVLFGVICVALVIVVEKLGAVLQLTITLSSVANGPLLGIFTAGVLVPWVESKGALIGGITSLIFMAWMAISAQSDIASGAMVYARKPHTTLGCNYTFMDFTPMSMLAENATEILEESNSHKEFHIYNISYLFYTMLGAILTIVIAIVISFISGPNKLTDIDTSLLSPFLQRWIENYKSKKVTASSDTTKNGNNQQKQTIAETCW
ncbi:sodium-coupled monocarboxylate transporter 1-like isoform X1 [Teleopsis dalmanni]|nr:sodium-coupled monocarboxylate transporter 1-like isoform X1 [Teleopsis dalmanni]